jgi:hypothetical protein
VKLNNQKTELRVLAHEVHHLMAGLRRCRCLLAQRHKPPPWHALPSLRLMQRMSPMIRDVSRYPDPAVWSEGGGQLAVLDHQDCCDD